MDIKELENSIDELLEETLKVAEELQTLKDGKNSKKGGFNKSSMQRVRTRLLELGKKRKDFKRLSMSYDQNVKILS